MLIDFEVNLVLVIKNKFEFVGRLKEEFLISYLDWEFLVKDVYYYDIYNDFFKNLNQEFYKYILYVYQKEYWCIIWFRYRENENFFLFFVEFGVLDDICEVICSE